MQRASFTFGFNPGGHVIVPVQAEPAYAPLNVHNLGQFAYTLEHELAPAGNPAPVVLAGKDDGREWRSVLAPGSYTFQRGHDGDSSYAVAQSRYRDGKRSVWLSAQDGQLGITQRTTIPERGSHAVANSFAGARLPVDIVRELLGEGAKVFASPYAQISANIELAQRLAILIYCELAAHLPESVRLRPVQGNSPMPPSAQFDAARLATPAIEVGRSHSVPHNVLAIFDTPKLAQADRFLVRGELAGWSSWPEFVVGYDAVDDVINVGQAYDDVSGFPLSPTLRRLFAVAENAVELRVASHKEANLARLAAEKSRGGPPV